MNLCAYRAHEVSKPVAEILGAYKSGYQKHHFHVFIRVAVEYGSEEMSVG